MDSNAGNTLFHAHKVKRSLLGTMFGSKDLHPLSGLTTVKWNMVWDRETASFTEDLVETITWFSGAPTSTGIGPDCTQPRLHSGTSYRERRGERMWVTRLWVIFTCTILLPKFELHQMITRQYTKWLWRNSQRGEQQHQVKATHSLRGLEVFDHD